MSFMLAVLAVLSGPIADAQCLSVKRRVTDSELIVTTSLPVWPGKDLPGYCQVRGTIKPNLGFEAQLPLQAGMGNTCKPVAADFAERCCRTRPENQTPSIMH